MRDIHPHWEAEEERPVAVRAKQADTPATPTAVSRRPAAVLGMLIVIGIGFGFFKGVDSLTGQVTPNGPMVRITADGMVPDTLNVEHGQTITFINDTSAPQRIESGTLCSDTGFCLQTDLLKAGQSATFTITPDMRSGSYDYTSGDAGNLRGTIVITTQTVDDFQDPSSVLQDRFLNDIATQAPTQPPAPASSNNTYMASAGIPRNPYTVDSEQGMTPPLPTTTQEGLNSAANQAQTTFAQTRGPIRQPKTGAGHWIVLIASVAVLWRVTRHHFTVTA